MSITVTVRNRVDFNTSAMLDLAVTLAIGFVQRRTAKGISLHGTAFPAYSRAYAEHLVEVGENANVDLTRTGAYLASIRELSRQIDANGNGRAVIGPGTGTSRSESGGRSPPHNLLGAQLSVKFPHLGLVPDEARRLAKQMVAVGIKQTR